jgi:hypothetical protein
MLRTRSSTSPEAAAAASCRVSAYRLQAGASDLDGVPGQPRIAGGDPDRCRCALRLHHQSSVTTGRALRGNHRQQLPHRPGPLPASLHGLEQPHPPRAHHRRVGEVRSAQPTRELQQVGAPNTKAETTARSAASKLHARQAASPPLQERSKRSTAGRAGYRSTPKPIAALPPAATRLRRSPSSLRRSLMCGGANGRHPRGVRGVVVPGGASGGALQVQVPSRRHDPQHVLRPEPSVGPRSRSASRHRRPSARPCPGTSRPPSRQPPLHPRQEPHSPRHPRLPPQASANTPHKPWHHTTAPAPHRQEDHPAALQPLQTTRSTTRPHRSTHLSPV